MVSSSILLEVLARETQISRAWEIGILGKRARKNIKTDRFASSNAQFGLAVQYFVATLQETRNQLLVKETLGHASVATTGRYLHARPTDSSSLYLES